MCYEFFIFKYSGISVTAAEKFVLQLFTILYFFEIVLRKILNLN